MLNELGININTVPVLDVRRLKSSNIIADRSYSTNPKNVDKNVRYMRSIAPHANPNKLMVSIFERYLNIEGQLIEAFNKYPHTTTYDCSTTFAPVTIFKIKELKDFR